MHEYTYEEIQAAFHLMRKIIAEVTPYPSRNFVLGKLEELHDAFGMTLDEATRERMVK